MVDIKQYACRCLKIVINWLETAVLGGNGGSFASAMFLTAKRLYLIRYYVSVMLIGSFCREIMSQSPKGRL